MNGTSVKTTSAKTLDGPKSLGASRPALAIAAGAAAALVAATVALWAHYGTAVFYEMIAAGIAACL